MENLEKANEVKAETQPFPAEVRSGKIMISDSSRLGELEEAGYGTRDGKALVLRDYEALYLLNAKKLELRSGAGDAVSFEDLAEETQRKASDSWTKFIIYRDLRSRGYIVKDGFGFGTDLRVYERGDFPAKAAKFVVFALDEGTEREVGELNESVRQIIKMGKEAIVAVIERRGEVIYYKVGRANFHK